MTAIPSTHGRNGRVGSHRRRRPEDAQKRLLGHVLGVLPVGEEPDAQAEDLRLEPLDQLAHGVRLPFEAAADQGGVVGGHGGPF